MWKLTLSYGSSCCHLSLWGGCGAWKPHWNTCFDILTFCSRVVRTDCGFMASFIHIYIVSHYWLARVGSIVMFGISPWHARAESSVRRWNASLNIYFAIYTREGVEFFMLWDEIRNKKSAVNITDIIGKTASMASEANAWRKIFSYPTCRQAQKKKRKSFRTWKNGKRVPPTNIQFRLSQKYSCTQEQSY